MPTAHEPKPCKALNPRSSFAFLAEGFWNSEHPLEVADCDTFRQRGLGFGVAGLGLRV